MAQARPPMTKEDFIDLKETIEGTLANAGIEFICYMWNEELDLGVSLASNNADIYDILLALSRIARGFNIKPNVLSYALQKELDGDGEQNDQRT